MNLLRALCDFLPDGAPLSTYNACGCKRDPDRRLTYRVYVGGVLFLRQETVNDYHEVELLDGDSMCLVADRA